jgi:hypothetical protein
VKIACDKADSRGPELGSEHIDMPEEVTKVDLALRRRGIRFSTKEQGMLRRPRTKL